MRIPDEFTEAEKVSGMWWRQLVAGGGAGVGKLADCNHDNCSHDDIKQKIVAIILLIDVSTKPFF